VSQDIRQPLVAIDHQLDPVADAAPHSLERPDVGAPVTAMETDLDRTKPFREVTLGRVREGLWPAQGSRRSIGAHPVGKAADQFPAGLACELAGQIPEREIERPAPAPVETNVVEDAPVAFERHDVLPNEQMLVTLEAEHHVARAVAG
jgi:hypothetical protein